MLSPKYNRLYHFHLKKTGGSTLNRWLDTMGSDDAASEAEAMRPFLSSRWRMEQTGELPRGSFEAARAVFYCADVVHTHTPLRRLVPPGTLCCTFLRDPVERILSQITDYQRLGPADIVSLTPAHQALIADTRQLSVRAYLERYGQAEGRLMLDNHMTRSLAAGRLGRDVRWVEDAGTLLHAAVDSLGDYEFVGLTGDFDVSRNALCAIAGLPSAGTVARINQSQKAGLDVAQARDSLEALSRFDRIVYEQARALFDERYRTLGEQYDAAAFEARYADELTNRMRGSRRDDATFYSVRLPLPGSGTHGRDAAGTADCAVWSGPATNLTLYMPVPFGMALSILVWIRGYASQRQRDQVRVKVDGTPAPHHFAPAPGYADLLVIDACPTRNFVRLEIDVAETLTSDQAGTQGRDDRKRGICFDGYGWRL